MSLIPIDQRETLLKILYQRNEAFSYIVGDIHRMDYLDERDGEYWVKLDVVAKALIPTHFEINCIVETPLAIPLAAKTR